MKVIFVQNNAIEVDALSECVAVLRSGGIVCYPTETFYALGVDPQNQTAMQKLHVLKRRPSEKDLPLIAADAAMVEAFCDTVDLRYKILSDRFWPGPLTLVLPSADHSLFYAIRVSSNPVARCISRLFGRPVISTSANRSGEQPVSNPDDLPDDLVERIGVLVNSGSMPGGAPSTIVSLLETPARILREGAIPSTQVLSIL